MPPPLSFTCFLLRMPMAASGIGTGRSPISRSRTIIEAGKDMASQMAPLDFAMLDQTTLRLRGPTNCGFHLFGATLAPRPVLHSPIM